MVPVPLDAATCLSLGSVMIERSGSDPGVEVGDSQRWQGNFQGPVLALLQSTTDLPAKLG
jgi:hypothetical protein